MSASVDPRDWPYVDCPVGIKGKGLTIDVGYLDADNSRLWVPAAGGNLVGVIIEKRAHATGKIIVWLCDCVGNVLQMWHVPPDMPNYGIQLPQPLPNTNNANAYTLAFGGGTHPPLTVYTINTVQ